MTLAEGGVSLCGSFDYHRSAAADTCLFPSVKPHISSLIKLNSQEGFFNHNGLFSVRPLRPGGIKTKHLLII